MSRQNNRDRRPDDLAGMRVTVVGLGRFGGGVGVTRWLCGQGAIVTVSDQASAESLAESVAQLADCDVTFHLGGHLEADLLTADLLVVNPAVPKESTMLAAAAAAGVPRTSEINLFLQRCTAPVVGVTGSVGKSTTTAMIGEIFARRFITYVGGNIGGSLLASLTDIRPHVVVMELSSFQLEDLPLVGISPRVAVVTNIQPNHLDRHGTMDAYVDAKKNIFAYQGPGDVLVLNAADEELVKWAAEAPGIVSMFDPAGKPFKLAVPGEHNQANAQAAWAAARAFSVAIGEAGLCRDVVSEILADFAGLPHRLQLVGERGGVRFVNDSKCTTPGGAIVALQAFEPGRCVIIVGGYDKGVSFTELGRKIASRAKAVIAIGATRESILAAVADASGLGAPAVCRADDFAGAVSLARENAKAGDVILLSPACASFGLFENYEQRGQAFIDLVS